MGKGSGGGREKRKRRRGRGEERRKERERRRNREERRRREERGEGRREKEGKDTDWASSIRNREGKAARPLTEMQKKFPIQERIKRIQQEETGCPVAGLREEFCLKENKELP